MKGTKEVRKLEEVVIRFSGDSGDGMQLTGTIFSDLSAVYGNSIATFPDYPAEIRAPQGTLGGVSGFQVHIGTNPVYTPGDFADVLVAMNPAALKVNINHIRKDSLIIIDTDSFTAKDLEKALFNTLDPIQELGLNPDRVIGAPILTMVKESLKEYKLDNKAALRCKNMFALGLVCWLFDRGLDHAEEFINRKFSKKELIRQANTKALNDGYNYGANTHASAGTNYSTTYHIAGAKQEPGYYMDMNGNKATSFGLIAAAEKSGLELFLGSYPITPATDILHELSKHKALNVVTVQAEDEIAGICTAIGASFAGKLAVTSTSGPGVALKSEAINLAVMAELPLVIVNVQRGGPSTGLPTKSEQTDLLQALYGRNGESPMPVISARSAGDCFAAAYYAAKIAVEHMTPVILLTDAYVANGSVAWKIPEYEQYPDIKPNYVANYQGELPWKPFLRDEETLVRYWAIPGQEGYMHRLGGLEKDDITGAISTNPANHQLMTNKRQAKIENIAKAIPPLRVEICEEADFLVIGWGGTYGHLHEAVSKMNKAGLKVGHLHFSWINPLPSNAAEILRKYSGRCIIAEQNLGQLALFLRGMVPGFETKQFNRVKGQPFIVGRLVEEFTKMMEQE